MAKQSSSPVPSQEESVTVYRVRPHLVDGKPVDGDWDTEEVTVVGRVVRRVVHERAQPLSVARKKWHVLTYRQNDRGEPETR